MEEKVLFNAVLVFLVHERGKRVCLATKMKKIGAGCLNGYGGGIESGESSLQAATRETGEESGVTVEPDDLEEVAVVDFENTKTDGTTFICRVRVFLAHAWKGEPEATDEMGNPLWFGREALPLDRMMPGDRIWFPLILNEKKIRAFAVYGPFQKELLEPVRVEEVDSLEGI